MRKILELIIIINIIVGYSIAVDLEELEKSLPGFDCGMCGFKTCEEFAKALLRNAEISPTRCVVLKKHILTEPVIKELLKERLSNKEKNKLNKEKSTHEERFTLVTYQEFFNEALKHLPRINCGACGYKTCDDFLKAVIEGKENPDNCKIYRKKFSDWYREFIKKVKIKN